MKTIWPLAAAAMTLIIVTPSALPAEAAGAAAPAPPAFNEVWGYLMAADPVAARSDLPLTDIAWFAAGLSYRGTLVGVPKPAAWPVGIRHHLVLAETGNASRIHFALDPQFGLRDRLVADLAAAAGRFDGVQIDFEAIEPGDAANFRNFLVCLKGAIGAKTLSVAVPARSRKLGDAYDYASLAGIADRVLVMAYDEHWGGGPPGSIASPGWARRVAAHACKVLGTGKLVMGVPFYGRVWADRSQAGAYRYTSIERMRKEQQAEIGRDGEGVPFFSFQSTVNYTVYFEDSRSLADKLAIYREAGVERVGFWRLGLEDPAFWPLLSLAAPAFGGPASTGSRRAPAPPMPR